MQAPPAPGQQPSQQQIVAMQQAMAAEAFKRGMTPQQFQAAQRAQLEADAKKAGLTFEQYINQLKQQAYQNHQRQQQLAQQQAASGQQSPTTPGPPQQGQQVPINPGTPDPRAVALAKWLRSQDLKARTCILNGQRKDMFRGIGHFKLEILCTWRNSYRGISSIKTNSKPTVKRALRAIESPAYTTASKKKNSNLPALTPTFPAAEIFKLLPLSLLALRVSKTDPHEGHGHAPPAKPTKRTKGLWHVRIEQQQDISPDLHYIFLYEGSQWRTKLYAGGALLLIMAVIMFPLWPVKLRIGVWYLSMGMVGLIALFFLMAIFRLILFVATMFTVPPGLWLYPNLFEDVGFFDSFRPVWGWQEEKKKKSKSSKKGMDNDTTAPTTVEGQTPSAPITTATSTATESGAYEKRNLTPRVEEVDED
ncbi:Translocation protein S62 [Xylographa trunciseda]|nr:Translocation protein S62 [Xylographa trunciseda]